MCVYSVKTLYFNYFSLKNLFVSALLSDKEEDKKEATDGGGLADKVSLYKGDITVLEVDTIVNAGRNSALFNLFETVLLCWLLWS